MGSELCPPPESAPRKVLFGEMTGTALRVHRMDPVQARNLTPAGDIPFMQSLYTGDLPSPCSPNYA